MQYFSENIAKSLLGESVISAMAIKQQNLFVSVMLKWFKDRFEHRLQFMGSLPWKA